MLPRFLAAWVRLRTSERYQTVVMRFLIWSFALQLVLSSREELDFGLMLYAHAWQFRRSELTFRMDVPN